MARVARHTDIALAAGERLCTRHAFRELFELQAIAVAQPRRAGIMPDVPTMQEAGLADFDAGIWMGLLAPANTPPDVVNKLSAAANEAPLATADVVPLRA